MRAAEYFKSGKPASKMGFTSSRKNPSASIKPGIKGGRFGWSFIICNKPFQFNFHIELHDYSIFHSLTYRRNWCYIERASSKHNYQSISGGNQMKIPMIECIPVSLKFAKPVVMSGGAEAASHSVIVKIHTDEGITGIGESGGTSLWYMGESQDSIMSNITNIFAPQILLGEDPFNIEKIVARMDKTARANNQSKAVVDYALHDLMGKALGVPVSKLLGGLSNPKIALAFVMSSGTPDEVGAEAKKLVKAGFKGLKLKVGARTPDEDIELVGALREAVGNKIKIMIDANGGWLYHQALYGMQRGAKYKEYVGEQPGPR